MIQADSKADGFHRSDAEPSVGDRELIEFFQRVFATSLDGILLTSPDGRTFTANPAACAMLGRTEAELRMIGRSAILDTTQPTSASMLETRRRYGRVCQEVELLRADGSKIWCELSSSTYLDGSGEERAVVILRDITDRRAAEAAYRGTEERLRLALEGGDLGLWDWNANSGVLTVNSRWKTMLGLPAVGYDPTIERWHALVHPDDMPVLDQLIREVIIPPAGRHFEAEVRARHADGHYVWILDKGAVVDRDSEGRPLRVVGTHMDITARKLAEAASRDAEAKLRFALDAADFGDWSRDIRTGGTRRSLQHDRCFGYSEPVHDWSYPTFLEHVHPLDRDRVDTAYRVALSDPGVYDVEFRAIWPDRTVHWLWLRGRVSFDDAGSPTQIAGIVADITRRRLAEQRQRDDATRLQLATEASNTGLWEWNPNTNEVFYSATWKRQLGYDDHELKNSFESWRDRLHPEDRDGALATAETAARMPGSYFEHEFRLRHRDGSYRWILAQASLVTDADGNPERFMGCHVDVTQRRSAEAAVRQSEMRFRGAIEASPIPMALGDRHGNLTYVNPQFVRTFRYELRDLPTLEAWWACAHPESDYRSWVRATWQAREATSQSRGRAFLPIELRVCCGDGALRTVVAQVADLDGSSGNTRLFVFIDVTEQRRLEGQVLDAVTHEQHRLARDLHDGLGQELTGLSLLLSGSARSLSGADPETIAAEMSRFAEIAQQCLISARAIAHGLSPISLENGGLKNALVRLAESTRRNSGVEVLLELRGVDVAAEVRGAIAEPIFRIVQEAVTNVLRHAGATQIEVRLSRVRRSLQLEIADNGCGFVEGGSSAGFGVQVMHYRARAIGGHLQIERREQGGTLVRCLFPAATSIDRTAGRA